jgi:hypothetical protein
VRVSIFALGLIGAAGCTSAPIPPDAGLPDAGPLPAPTVTSILPNTGPVDGGTVVSVEGTNFQTSARLLVGSGVATSVSVVSPFQITGATPPGPPGPATVAVINSDGQSGALPAGFTYIGPPPPWIQFCKLQFVNYNTVNAVASGDPMTVYGRVGIPGLTESPTPPPGLRAEAGVGAQGDNASMSTAWAWNDAVFNLNVDGGLDEYVATVTPAYSGNRAVSFRFSLGDAGWTYCDSRGEADGGYDPTAQWNVAVSTNASLAFCNTQYPPTLTQWADGGAADGSSNVVYGQIYQPGVTPSATAPVKAYLGFVPYANRFEDPGLSANWTWVGAPYDAPTVHPNNNEYNTEIPLAPPGTYAYAFRFSLNGSSYCYGDLDGNGSNGAGQPWGGFVALLPDGGDNLGVATLLP